MMLINWNERGKGAEHSIPYWQVPTLHCLKILISCTFLGAFVWNTGCYFYEPIGELDTEIRVKLSASILKKEGIL